MNEKPDDYHSLPDEDSGLRGETWRESYERRKAELPPIEFVLIERRKIGDWELNDQ